jgi:hypothetical protein
MIQIHWKYPEVSISDTSMIARVESGTIRIAHMGCKLAKTCLPARKLFPQQYLDVAEYLDRQYGSRRVWNTSQPATTLLARSLASLLQYTGATGIELVDTMRKGSDYWRPGNLLSEAVRSMESNAQLESNRVSFGRFDALCPSALLLQEFQRNESMAFGEYAAAYAAESNARGLELAVSECIVSNARGRIPVYYCTDPFLRGYCSSSQALGDYRLRTWMPALRDAGCHRVVLVEELVKAFTAHGFQVELFELDQLAENGLHRRLFSSSSSQESY